MMHNPHVLEAFVRIILNLGAFFRALSKFFLPSSQIFKFCKGQIQNFFGVKNPLSSQTTDIQPFANSTTSFPFCKGRERPPARASLPCNGALIALQRGARCDTAACPRHYRKGPIARQGPLFCTFPAIRKPQTFAFRKSREGLTASNRCFFNRISARHSCPVVPRQSLFGETNMIFQRCRQLSFCKNICQSRDKYRLN